MEEFIPKDAKNKGEIIDQFREYLHRVNKGPYERVEETKAEEITPVLLTEEFFRMNFKNESEALGSKISAFSKGILPYFKGLEDLTGIKSVNFKYN